MRYRALLSAFVLMVVLAALACSGTVERTENPGPDRSGTPTPVLSPTPSSEGTPSPTSTPTSTPLPNSSSPSPRPSPNSSPRPTPTPQLFLDVQGPQDGLEVSGDAVVVFGMTSPGATLTIASRPVEVEPDGRFQAEVSVAPGPNTIEVIARDITGNEVTKAVTVTAPVEQTQPLVLVVTRPKDQSIVTSSPVQVNGRTSPGAVVTVNGVSVAIDASGVFSTSVVLESGPNIIEVVATSVSGEQLSAIIAVIYRPR